MAYWLRKKLNKDLKFQEFVTDVIQ